LENTVETRWFSFDIKGACGKVFATIEDIKAGVTLDEDGEVYEVLVIFTTLADGEKVYLPMNDLWPDIEYYIIVNFDDLRDEECQGGRDDEHRLTAGELGVGGKR